MEDKQRLIRLEENGTLAFGDFRLQTKQKVLDFENGGDLYQVKSFSQITRLEKNGRLLLEAVPGATIRQFFMDEESVSFELEAAEDVRVTMELCPDTVYTVAANGAELGKVTANVAGKISFSLGMAPGQVASVEIKRADG